MVQERRRQKENRFFINLHGAHYEFDEKKSDSIQFFLEHNRTVGILQGCHFRVKFFLKEKWQQAATLR